MRKTKDFNLKHDKRRKHHHWLVEVFYLDGESFGKVCTDLEKARKYATRQKRSPLVKRTRIQQELRQSVSIGGAGGVLTTMCQNVVKEFGLSLEKTVGKLEGG
jgi:hypothetical protein